MYRALFSRQGAPALRSRSTIIRHNTSAASKTNEVAQSTQAKATEALSSAQKGFERVLGQAKNVSGKVGGTLGSFLGGYREPVLYNLSVAREFFKQVYIREKLAPPTSLSSVTSTYSTLFARARDLNYWREIARTGEWATIGVIGLEAYFIFHIGEMIGRRSIVGYKLDEPKTH